jgi:membrane protease YdiL (CAAX protease family)
MPELSPNPYRQLLRRRFPVPLLAALALLVGIWMWKQYFDVPHGFEPGTDQLVMLKLDRDYRLARAMERDPQWLRQLLSVESAESARHRGIEALDLLGQEGGLTPESVQALVVAIAEEERVPILRALRQSSVHVQNADYPERYEVLVEKLAAGKGTWWEYSVLEAYAQERLGTAELTRALARFDGDSAVLRHRTLVARLANWILILVGTAFIPRMVKRVLAIEQSPTSGYAAGWSPSLGVTVFLAATLAWIGFSFVIGVGFSSLADIPRGMVLMIDAVIRLLPALVAVAFLFRRPHHATRVLGLNRGPSWSMVLGAFALLGWSNEILLPLLERHSAPNPTGGLSYGEVGYWGLMSVILSACLLAPFAEEVLYRGVLFQALGNRLGLVSGAVLSSLAFSLVHFYNLYGLATVGLFGFVCALVFAGSRSLTTAIVLHILYNAAVKIPEWVVYHAPLS